MNDGFKITLMVATAFLAGHSLFLSIVLIRRRGGAGSWILGVMLLLLLVRVGKSVVSLAFPDVALASSVAGLAAMAGIGPLLCQYTASLFQNAPAAGWIGWRYAAHFIPSLLCLGLWSWPWLNAGYYAVALQLLIYISISISALFTHRAIFASDNIRWKWALGINGGVFVLWAMLTTQLFVYRQSLYVLVVGLSVMLAYGLALWAVGQYRLFMSPARSRPAAGADEYQVICRELERLMHDDIFLDPGLNLSKMAALLNKPAYLVSRAINGQFRSTFPELLSKRRIARAEKLLLSAEGRNLTIEAIAYDSGFTTLSAFYAAFKKVNGITPAQYRKNAEKTSDMAITSTSH